MRSALSGPQQLHLCQKLTGNLPGVLGGSSLRGNFLMQPLIVFFQLFIILNGVKISPWLIFNLYVQPGFQPPVIALFSHPRLTNIGPQRSCLSKKMEKICQIFMINLPQIQGVSTIIVLKDTWKEWCMIYWNMFAENLSIQERFH